MALIKLTDARRSTLDALIQSMGKNSNIGKAARTVLLSAGGADTMTVASKLGISNNRVRGVLRVWRDAEYRLTLAEQRGKRELQKLIRQLLEQEDDCCCGCDDIEEETGMDREELNALARKVFELLNYELRIERERLGYFG
jgi:hypothetical protein